MTTYTLILDQKQKTTPDTRNTLILKIDTQTKPVYLSDFIGGKATLFDGFSGTEVKFKIEQDSREFVVILNNLNGINAKLTSPWEREKILKK